jgi:hypothetical protein
MFTEMASIGGGSYACRSTAVCCKAEELGRVLFAQPWRSELQKVRNQLIKVPHYLRLSGNHKTLYVTSLRGR